MRRGPWQRLGDAISRRMFAGLPDHYPLRYKLVLWKANSVAGRSWDIFQTILSLLACAFYVVETYIGSVAWDWLEMSELVFSQFFLIDFLFNIYIADHRVRFMLSLTAWVDIMTILPAYVRVLFGFSAAFGFLRFVRVLRIMRILRAFKMLNSTISPIKRQILVLSLTLLSLIFLAAGMVQLFENEVQQYSLRCRFSNAATHWEPSCSDDKPAWELPSCDCASHNCESWPARMDPASEPSDVRCVAIDFFSALYFIVITVSTVGYGDISPTTTASKAAVICFVSLSFVLIPMQVNKLTALFSMQSRYRRPFASSVNEEHVLVVGHVTDRNVLRCFFQEFFHPDRFEPTRIDRHAVILSPVEPDEEISSLLLAPFMAGRVTYRIGSVLSREDLDNVSANTATACFVLCDRRTRDAASEDMATILRALSLENYSPACDTYVQIISPASKSALIEADVDVLLCVDEMKLALLARSCICPGLSTLLDNLFHTFSSDKTPDPTEEMPGWRTEYLAGCALEVYYVDLPKDLLELFHRNFSILADGVFTQFNVLLIGIDRTHVGGSIYLNPPPHFVLRDGDVGVVIARDGLDASQITNVATDTHRMGFLESAIAESASVQHFRKSVLRHFHLETTPSSSSSSTRSLPSQSPSPPPRPQQPEHHHQRKHLDHGSGSGSGLSHSRKSLFPGQPLAAAAAAACAELLEPALEESQLENCSHLKDHILVCGSRDNLPLFVKSLRTPELIGSACYRAIVILYPKPVADYKDWAELCEFPDVFYLEGTPTSPADLERANVDAASCLCLLAERDSLREIEGQQVNANVIVTFLAIEQLLPRDLFTLTELTCSSNMGVLNAKMLRRSHWLAQGGEMSSLAKTSSDRLTGFFTAQRSAPEHQGLLADALQGELGRSHRRPAGSNAAQAFGRAEGHQLMSFFASGRGYVADLFDTVLCQAYYNMQSTTLVEQLIIGSPPGAPDAEGESYMSGHLMTTPVPAGFAGQVFRQLLRHMLFVHHLLPVALYRAPTTANEAPMPYVYTGPAASTVLNAEDVMFVLGDPVNMHDGFGQFAKCVMCSG